MATAIVATAIVATAIVATAIVAAAVGAAMRNEVHGVRVQCRRGRPAAMRRGRLKGVEGDLRDRAQQQLAWQPREVAGVDACEPKQVAYCCAEFGRETAVAVGAPDKRREREARHGGELRARRLPERRELHRLQSRLDEGVGARAHHAHEGLVARQPAVARDSLEGADEHAALAQELKETPVLGQRGGGNVDPVIFHAARVVVVLIVRAALGRRLLPAVRGRARLGLDVELHRVGVEELEVVRVGTPRGECACPLDELAVLLDAVIHGVRAGELGDDRREVARARADVEEGAAGDDLERLEG